MQKRSYVAKDANIRLREYLKDMGRTVELISTEGVVDRRLSNHPDIFLCKMGIDENAPVILANTSELGPIYPMDCKYNAACTGKYFIHDLSHTSPTLLKVAEEMNMTLVHVRQGYSKCSIAIVDSTSVITYDDGIARTLGEYPDINVLKIRPGFVKLDGYNTGFIGGACGRVENQIIFNGDLAAHPDFPAIIEFIEARGLTVKWFPEYQLTDIGSIL